MSELKYKLLVIVTVLLPGMTTESPFCGTRFKLHVEVVFQSPLITACSIGVANDEAALSRIIATRSKAFHDTDFF